MNQTVFSYPSMKQSMDSIVEILEHGKKEEIQTVLRNFEDAAIKAQGYMRLAHEVMEAAHKECSSDIRRLLGVVRAGNSSTNQPVPPNNPSVPTYGPGESLHHSAADNMQHTTTSNDQNAVQVSYYHLLPQNSIIPNFSICNYR
jgi:hypothetical protein